MAQKPLAIFEFSQGSYVWEPFRGHLSTCFSRYGRIMGPLGPSSANLGPLLQPTCYSTSPLGTLMPELRALKLCLLSFNIDQANQCTDSQTFGVGSAECA